MADLESLYQRPGFQMVILYGRRRVGKTELITQFLKDKPGIYYRGIEETAKDNLRLLSHQINRFISPQFAGGTYEDFMTVFEQVQALADQQASGKLVFALDEYPYLAQSDPAISSVLQQMIDHPYKRHENIMLILCGSSMSFMEHQVLGRQSPLYGRRTAQLKLLPFDLFGVAEMLPTVPKEDLLAYYAMTGGVPQYLKYIDPQLSVSENIQALFLSPLGPLFAEPGTFMHMEIRTPAVFNSVVGAIARGADTNNQIAQAVGESPAKLNYYLNALIELGIVAKEYPVIGKATRPRYRISDGLFQFWYTFVNGETDAIMSRNTTGLLAEIEQQLPVFLGRVFEQACADWIRHQADLPVPFHKVGRWWGTNPKLKRREELDLVVPDEKRHAALLGECKWRDARKLTPEVIDRLVERALLVPGVRTTYLYCFVKDTSSEFSAYAAQHDVQVVTYRDFFAEKAE